MTQQKTRNHPAVSLVIPVFNNEKTLTPQLQLCQKIMEKTCSTYEILISNDASSDSTKEKLEPFAKQKNVRIFHQKKNLGIAENLKFLYKKAQYPYVLLFSVDGDWDVNDLMSLIKTVKTTNSDIVIGKREVKDYPLSRKLISYVYNVLPVLLFNIKIYDIGSIKIFKKEIFLKNTLRATSVAFEAEMLIKAIRNGYTFTTIPVVHKKHRDNKKSGVNAILVLNSLSDLLQLRMQKL